MSHATLKEKAYDRLRLLILNGELKPGDYLTERTLVDMLGMSRTPIRSALERLEAEGLASYSPNRGLMVTETSLQRAVDFYDIRAALESHVVRRLAQRKLSGEQIAWFEANLARQRECAAAHDYETFTRIDSEFHLQLARVYENMEIVQTMERLQDNLYRIALRVLRKDNSRIDISCRDHEEIFLHIREGRGKKAAEAMHRHLEFGKQILIQ